MESNRSERQSLLHSDSSQVEVRTSCSHSGVRAAVVLTVLVGLLATVTITIVLTKQNGDVSASGEYRSGVVISDHQTCSRIGSDIMRYHNGSAVDAAIATVLCTGVTGAQASGIGGGHFMTIYDTPRGGGEQKQIATINGRAVAPAAASRDMFRNVSASKGALAVALPGEVRGLYEAWSRFGKLPWKQLAQPTIDLCVHGFTVSRTLSDRIKSSRDSLMKFEGTRSVFLRPDGSPFEQGDVMRRPVLAATLQRLVDDGPESFYTGTVARDIIRDLSDVGGIITSEDLKNYEATVEEPMAVPLRGLNNETLDLYVPKLPSGGPILQFLLRVLEGYRFDNAPVEELKKNVDLHQILAETFKFGFALRSFLGDDKFSDMTEPLHNLTSDDFIKSVRSRLDLEHTHNWTYYGSDYLPAEDHGTSQVIVLAPDGSAVAVTTSVNGYFGSCIYGKRTGILFNNDMDDFSSPFTNNEWGIRPSAANFIAPGKRPLSSMTPTIILDHVTKLPRLVIGGAGGSKITTMVALTSYLHLMLGVDLLDAIDFPRVHHQLLPDQLSYEPDVNMAVMSSLKDRGHDVKRSGHIAVVCGAARECDDGDICVYRAVGDHRRNSVPYGWS